MQEVAVRQASVKEAERLAAVYRNAYQENRQLGFPAKAESVAMNTVAEWIRDNVVLVATTADEIVGGLRLETTDTDRLKLSRLCVHEDWKRRGIGSKLVAFAEDWGTNTGYDIIWLTTPEKHPYLPEFYRNRGYERTGRYPLKYRDYDEIVMEKELP